MKCLSLFVIGSMLAAFSAQAIEVRSAKLDAAKKTLIVSVVHGGGCGEHDYKLELQGCLESMPVQCTATIKHLTSDPCEAMLSREVEFDLAAHGLSDEYYSGGSLRILGSNNSKASITLPEAGAAGPVSGSKIQCTTHTGSTLVIGNGKVTLVTIANEAATYEIVKTEGRSIETFPPIDQKTYVLDDGRSLIIKFKSGEVTGKGKFLRLDGTYSPDFTCSK